MKQAMDVVRDIRFKLSMTSFPTSVLTHNYASKRMYLLFSCFQFYPKLCMIHTCHTLTVCPWILLTLLLLGSFHLCSHHWEYLHKIFTIIQFLVLKGRDIITYLVKYKIMWISNFAKIFVFFITFLELIHVSP